MPAGFNALLMYRFVNTEMDGVRVSLTEFHVPLPRMDFRVVSAAHVQKEGVFCALQIGNDLLGFEGSSSIFSWRCALYVEIVIALCLVCRGLRSHIIKSRSMAMSAGPATAGVFTEVSVSVFWDVCVSWVSTSIPTLSLCWDRVGVDSKMGQCGLGWR